MASGPGQYFLGFRSDAGNTGAVFLFLTNLEPKHIMFLVR